MKLKVGDSVLIPAKVVKVHADGFCDLELSLIVEHPKREDMPGDYMNWTKFQHRLTGPKTSPHTSRVRGCLVNVDAASLRPVTESSRSEVREALRALLVRVIDPGDPLVRYLSGNTITAGQMLEWLDASDPRADEFIRDATQSIVNAMANESLFGTSDANAIMVDLSQKSD